MIYRLLILFVILFLNAFFAASEVALVSVRRSRLKTLADQGNSSAQAALDLLAKPERLLSVTQFGVTLASLGLGWAGEDTLYTLMAGLLPHMAGTTDTIVHGLVFGVAFLLISYGHVTIGEVVPKNLALEKSDRLALMVAPALSIFYRISAPLISVIERSASAISRSFGLTGEHGGGGHSPEELKFIVSSSRKEGHLEAFEEEAIQKIIDLQKFYAREIMVPRNNMVSVPVDANLDQVLRVLDEHKFSRIPVHDGTSERIVGILYYKDLIRLWLERKASHDRNRADRPFRLRRYLRKPLVVPETKALPQLLADFRDAHTHLALVVDEFGTIAGLVTLEDVLEQVVGEIADEHDIPLAKQPSLEAAEIEVQGTIPARDLENSYGIALPGDAGFETLAGFLLFKLGYIPKEGESVIHADRRFVITKMDRNRIALVRIERTPVEGEPQPPANAPALA